MAHLPKCAADPQGSQAEPEPAPEPKKARKGMSDADKAQLKCKGQRDKLAQAQKRYQFLIEKTRDNAKTLAQSGKKKEAMILLKKKKMLEVQLKSAEDQFMQMEQLIQGIEQAGYQAKFAESMAAGNEALKSITESMGGLEGVERLMEDTADTQAEWREIEEAMGAQGSGLDAEDEEAVMAEFAMLEEMEGLDLADQMPDAPTVAPIGTAAEPQQVEEPEPEREEPARQMVAA